MIGLDLSYINNLNFTIDNYEKSPSHASLSTLNNSIHELTENIAFLSIERENELETLKDRLTIIKKDLERKSVNLDLIESINQVLNFSIPKQKNILSILPKDIFFEIFKFLDHKNLGSIPKTCKSLRNLFFDPNFLVFFLERYNDRLRLTDKLLLAKKAGENLIKLDLSNTNIDDKQLEDLIKHCPNLQSLNIAGCLKITDTGIQVVATHLKALTSLNIGCVRVTNTSIQTIATHLKALTSLNIASCKNVTDTGIQAIATHLKNLTSLNIAGCKEVTNTGIRAIATRLNALTSLNITGCNKVTDPGIQAIATHLKDLTSLTMPLCEGVTDIGFKDVATHLNALTSLNIAFCKEVTNAGIQAIATHLKALESIDIKGCRKVTNIGIAAFSKKVKMIKT